MPFYTYLVCSQRNGTLYAGHTDDLVKRCWQHRHHQFPGFAARYGCKRLVWFEVHDTRDAAFTRERQIKEWKRLWKLDLIEADNPQWRDLYDDLVNWTPAPSALDPGFRRDERA